MTGTEEAGRRQYVSPRNWALWKRPRNWIVYTLSTEALTLGLTIAAVALVSVNGRQVTMFAILAVLGILQAEASRKIERIRRTLSVTPHVSMTSVWLLPAALLLPLPLIALLTVVLYVHLGMRSWSGIRHVAPHRIATNTATMTLSTFAGSLLPQLFLGSDPMAGDAAGAVCLAALGYFVINTAITAGGLYLAAPEKASVDSLIGNWDDNMLDIATLCLGGLLVLALVNQPLLSLVIFVPIFVLQRSVLAKQLEELASKDQKTGLLNAVAWHENGEREVSRVSRVGGEFSVLMIDLDFFKKINDTYGHLAGDDMLISLADLLKRETRSHDLVGRFGGEEFVVLLAGSSEDEALVAAERIRMLINQLVVYSQSNEGTPVAIQDRSASIGVAAYPTGGLTLDEVLASADAAVYAAKRTGRNKVVGSAIPDSVVTTPG
jgi:diguanylate cyclase (GGDEF)-like protein